MTMNFKKPGFADYWVVDREYRRETPTTLIRPGAIYGHWTSLFVSFWTLRWVLPSCLREGSTGFSLNAVVSMFVIKMAIIRMESRNLPAHRNSSADRFWQITTAWQLFECSA